MASVNLIKFLDKFVGPVSCLFLFIFKAFESKKSDDLKYILIIQLWGLGESVLTLPAIEALRKKYKNCNIDILVTKRNKDVYFKNKSIDNVRALSLNPISIILFMLSNFRKYDLAIDMEEYLNVSSIIAFFVGERRIGFSHGIRSNLYTDKVNYNGRQHVVYTFLDLLRPLGFNEKANKLPRLHYSEIDKKNVDRLFKKLNIGGGKLIAGFGIGAAESAKSRMWPADRYAEVADYLIEKFSAKVILLGNEEEKGFANEIQRLMKDKNNSFNVSGLISTRELFYLISLCSLFIGNDSGPMHIAASQGVRTIGLFGCNLPMRFSPFGQGSISIRKQVGKACINVHKGEIGECRHGKDNACVKKIKVLDVTKMIKNAIRKK